MFAPKMNLGATDRSYDESFTHSPSAHFHSRAGCKKLASLSPESLEHGREVSSH
jgi:hypothetical protein